MTSSLKWYRMWGLERLNLLKILRQAQYSLRMTKLCLELWASPGPFSSLVKSQGKWEIVWSDWFLTVFFLKNGRQKYLHFGKLHHLLAFVCGSEVGQHSPADEIKIKWRVKYVICLGDLGLSSSFHWRQSEWQRVLLHEFIQLITQPWPVSTLVTKPLMPPCLSISSKVTSYMKQ